MFGDDFKNKENLFDTELLGKLFKIRLHNNIFIVLFLVKDSKPRFDFHFDKTFVEWFSDSNKT